ncbi:MAG TPA: DUF2723 domain-containing protein, partial [Caldilineaceae bacterium]|nr:DUF2723 domain-containing protein [Caldilineaceae bacterium]
MLQPALRPAHTTAARWMGVALVVAFLGVYALTLDTGLQPYELRGGDLITHQYAQVQARPSNAPGYPLYTLGGWLWFHGWRALLRLSDRLPNPIPILSSYSTLWAILALWLLYHIQRRLAAAPDRPGGNWPVAWLVTAFFGVTYFFWYYATTTEQYSSAVAQTLAIVYLYLLWRERPRRLSLLYLLAFLCGLSLAHMLTVALIVPPLVAAVLWQAPWLLRSPRALAGSIIAALLPLASYLYVYWRGAAHPEWWGAGEWRSAQEWFWAFVSTAQGREELAWGFEPGRAFFGNGFPQTIWQELSLPLLLAGLAGLLYLDRRLRLVIGGTLGLYLVFCWAYRYGNWFQVVLPAYPLILLGVAPLADHLARAAQRLAPPRLAHWLILGSLAVALVWRAQASLPAADSRCRPEDTALDRAARLLNEPLPAQAGLFAAVDDALALTYLTQIWGMRSDLTVVSSPQAARWLREGRPLFATWDATPALLAELPGEPAVTLQSAGAEWVALAPAGAGPVSPPATPVGQELLPGLTLAGYTTSPAPTGAPVVSTTPPALDVLLFWRLASGAWPDGVAISVRPMRSGVAVTGAAGEIIQQDRPRPVHGLWSGAPAAHPTTVADGYRLPLPKPLPEGADGF